MSTDSYSYKIYEGSFLTTQPLLDRSVNILMFQDPDENEYQIIITRGTLGEEQTAEEWCEAEIEKMRNTMPGFEIEGKQLKHELGPAKLPVIQTANRYLRDGDFVRQVQSIVTLPPNPRYNVTERDVIVFSLNSIKDFNDFQRKHYVQVINSFIPDI